MSEIEKLSVELILTAEEIRSLNEKKRAIEAELKQFTNTVREICAATGKTMDEIEV